jgi:RNA polymerase sigma-70 factor (ECF subfamily)
VARERRAWAADDDAALVTAAQSGDRDALEELLRRHADRVYALCRRITGDADDAADAAQEAMLAIVRGLGRFDGRSAFATWAYRVATNACLDELRRRRRRPDPMELTEADLISAVTDAHAAVATRLDVDDALRRLPLAYRAAVVLRDLCSLDYAEIAAVLDIPVGTVRSRIARGRAALVPHLGNPDTDDNRPTQQP